jgi:hypothetical protein
MNNRLMFRPDLMECILEDRALMAIANLGLIIQTTSGLALITPPSAPMGVINQPANGNGAMNNGATLGIDPQLGMPKLGPANMGRGRLTGPLPGSLVPITPMLPGNN